MKTDITVRIVVVDPPSGVDFAVQRGRNNLQPPEIADGDFVLEFTLTVTDPFSKAPRLTSPFEHGPPNKRFVYVNTGSRAGQPASRYDRGVKVPHYSLSGVDIKEALSTCQILEAKTSGRSADGSPASVTLPFINSWKVAQCHLAGFRQG